MLIGVRNLDEEEKDRVRASRIHVFTMKDIDRAGIARVIEQAIELAGRDAAGIHVSFDLDVCDPADRARRRDACQGRSRLPRGDTW